MKSLIVGGMHGNEPLGIDLFRLLSQRPVAGVDTILANPRAVRAGVRYIEADLNRSFGTDAGSYECKRAQELVKLARKYDVVLDFHNTQTPDNDCGFIGAADGRLLQLMQTLDLQHCVIATYDCINKVCSNVLSVEISLQSTKNSAAFWYERIKQLQEGAFTFNILPKLYRYERRVTWQDQKLHNLHNWRPFEPLTVAERQIFQLSGTIVPIFIGSRFTEYYATLLSLEQNDGTIDTTL